VLYFLLIIALLTALYILYILNFSGKKVNIRTIRKISQFDKKYSIKATSPITTTLSGTKHNDCQLVITRQIRQNKIKVGTKVILVPDTLNLHDDTATRVCTSDGWMLGWLPDESWNSNIYYDLLNGKKWEATIKEYRRPSTEFNFHNLLIELWEYTENHS
jgi:hypothetical protein